MSKNWILRQFLGILSTAESHTSYNKYYNLYLQIKNIFDLLFADKFNGF